MKNIMRESTLCSLEKLGIPFAIKSLGPYNLKKEFTLRST
ncbi:hypothetical protein CpecG_0648 [Chlamydia pecorum MC/MarsBar]|uniref:Uncharacterized protein n=1 Tax=Chlamydia pecorum (strain ATCC VR-628 / DSM 29919 / E58) TaxID=331635 RepID=A0AA34RDG8_CHLPE|nr:hypothetical protein G5S_0741 [Chlamydia pecorum E58]ETF37455.1 hypothetical protein CpecS_0649 [Chlamydia pecorum VR629]ETF37963.1 hypothetical protein CpecF_0649 [Chlamydia pecorum DBDeUG]ETF38231.1 hypothetical protein CpecG_0648 [Chlamydia pecorum MC/MarsBar]ETF40198.1 hypothetical protein CpecA_0648 [Chlamydia pecorum IPTaLE]